MKIARLILSLLASVCFSISYAANLASPVGKWVTFDDKTHKPAGLVEIYENNGLLYGRILKNLGEDNIVYCHHCPGELNEKPLMGLTFLWGFSPTKDNKWTQGKVIDPHDGKIYRASMWLIKDGKQLAFRGYWGIFWRTQVWKRSE